MKKLFLLGAALLGLCAFGSAARAGGDDSDDYSYRQPRVYEGRPVYRERVVEDDYCPPRVYVRPLPPPIVYGGYYGPRPYGYYGYHRRHFYHRPVVSFGIGF